MEALQRKRLVIGPKWSVAGGNIEKNRSLGPVYTLIASTPSFVLAQDLP
jgi:hypothetical protein